LDALLTTLEAELEWIIIAIGIIGNLILFAYGYGKLTSYAEKNKVDIKEIKDNCGTLRRNCHDDSLRVDKTIFDKLEDINNNILKLSIQVAKLERDQNA